MVEYVLVTRLDGGFAGDFEGDVEGLEELVPEGP
jgi:hypothetical protein